MAHWHFCRPKILAVFERHSLLQHYNHRDDTFTIHYIPQALELFGLDSDLTWCPPVLMRTNVNIDDSKHRLITCKSVCKVHLPAQNNPSPVKSRLHMQDLKPGRVISTVQVAFWWQPPLFTTHLLISVNRKSDSTFQVPDLFESCCGLCPSQMTGFNYS